MFNRFILVHMKTGHKKSSSVEISATSAGLKVCTACSLSWFDRPTHVQEQLLLAHRCKTACAVHYTSNIHYTCVILDRPPQLDTATPWTRNCFSCIWSLHLSHQPKLVVMGEGWNVDQLVSWEVSALRSESAFTTALQYSSRMTTADVSRIRVPQEDSPFVFWLCATEKRPWCGTNTCWRDYISYLAEEHRRNLPKRKL